ncbi:hypothetical protein BOW53_14305 [Solemya pervernicosa gill symbiont]|uniref:ATP-grasp domain-containing protein n=2 Tax=Gammaproteobacteria incertae sedis TaxID=118884 RepID=A0A1T2L0X7_9GAMM|nr:hypothetical protein [Candidatus Reidiella endopervernicosa]OOZ38765.1 hypothetical protein BOW53_14305 [Solemya pervernicosa gill symbiont]
MLYALRRGPRAVIGDGEHTVSELIELANKKLLATPPWKRSKAIPLDELALDSITENGFSPETIPEPGTTVPIRKIESSEWSGDITDASDQVHPDNRAIALRAAELFQLSNAGIDIISSDISIPWHQNGAIINEVNFAPYFGGHPTARARLPHYFENFIEGDGRIPVEVVIGGSEAEKTARKIQQLQVDGGTACYLTSHYLTITPSLQEMPFPSISLFTRTIALLMNRKVESVVLLIQTDEFIQTGLPVDRIRHITQTGGVISEWQSNNSPIDNERRKMLNTLLSSYLITTTPL